MQQVGGNEVKRTFGGGVGQRVPLCPNGSHINLFGHLERVIDFDAEIPDRTFDLGMTEQSRFIMHLGLTH